ncbi:hypothetical protein MTAT_19830 [Moorella thermoacetica]|uniref:Uncharacterized protein n=1 Tax=Neomoorella thermoacetica TaxID=1525 RepID=A0AAC9HIR5_NEOTH|nr:DUF6557 family protein [Moorella thermoacetica]AOQ24638.1 hypothetical protein Maut_02210 [Moorella thermoacetica]TYL12741.1 hypothetical protein MTAT_19830 [Moorella thermoacetica]
MLTVQELFKSVEWDRVAASLVALYPEEKPNLEGYAQVYHRMLSIVPEPNVDGTAVFIEPFVDCDGNTYHDVAGVTPGCACSFALDFCSFARWASFFVDAKVFDNYSSQDAVAHILYEMTYVSFDDEEISHLRNELEEIVDSALMELFSDVT